MRSPGLVLTLFAFLVAAITNGLVSAHANGIALSSPSDVVGQQQSQSAAPVDHPLLPPILAGRGDELLASPMLRDPEFMAEVGRWVHFWETERTEWFPGYLARMTWFEGMVDTTLAAHGLPWSLRYLPVIESGYSTSAVSSAKAVGLWQLMPATAEDLGVEVTRFVDDRRDPFEFDRVPVRGAFTFEGLARATGAKLEEIARLNPEYVRGVTPDRRRVDVRVPVGLGQSVRDYYASGARGKR